MTEHKDTRDPPMKNGLVAAEKLVAAENLMIALAGKDPGVSKFFALREDKAVELFERIATLEHDEKVHNESIIELEKEVEMLREGLNSSIERIDKLEKQNDLTKCYIYNILFGGFAGRNDLAHHFIDEYSKI